MTRWLLDTNIVSDLIRNPAGVVSEALESADRAEIFTSVLVSAELRFGAAKRGSSRLSRQVEIVLAQLHVEPFDPPADQAYARLRTELESRGRLISAFDMLIAAHALSTEAILVTDNTREFERVPGLRIENWLRP